MTRAQQAASWRPSDDIILWRRAVDAATCTRWAAGARAARATWLPNFDGVQFTLGRAYYTHLEEDRVGDYFAGARASDALVEQAMPGLQDQVRQLLSAVLQAPIEPRPGWCGPGLHVFPAGGWLARHGGDVHFDTEGLSQEDLDARAPALSAILMLQPPVRGGGLRLWDAFYAGQDDVPDDVLQATPHQTIDYGPGDLLVIDSYRLHQIQPFTGATDRLSATAHLVLRAGRWQSWF